MTTPVHRQSELSLLLDQMRHHPSRDWSATRERAFILARLLAREQPDHSRRP